MICGSCSCCCHCCSVFSLSSSSWMLLPRVWLVFRAFVLLHVGDGVAYAEFIVSDLAGSYMESLEWSKRKNLGLGPIIFQKPEQAERLADLFNLPIEERTYVAPAEIIPLESKIFSRTNSMSSAQAKSSTLSDEDAMDRLKNRKRSAASSGHS
ncbi:uncharacterized protein LOC104905614 isoform X3 [Beta vulgaris subsp. vulgaris]|uniref:uncharacterized protein LOC104905614 isoform X3 n=1 Tax=Beta vulgaris subsp. vulgaris TaxID=3555 RepID=UPI00203740E9|nr:uncharacterized protein LOC104905614 isoform X3 [Beta vulgaris subsp. vulgaris]